MPIQSGDVKLLKSAVMADVPEGGGAPTGNAIADGVSNSIFPDISELDRAGGRVSLRKTFAAIHTDDRDTYFGANVIVADPPNDPRVSVTLFSNRDTFDTRAEAQARVEAYLNQGAEWAGYLYENHIAGQRVVQLFQRPSDILPNVGQTLVLVQNEGSPTQKLQYIRATAVSSIERTFTYGVDQDYKARVVTIELSDALRFDFTGSPAARTFTRTPDSTRVRDTVVADAGTYAGVVEMTEAASVGAFTIKAESIFTQLVPSAQTESPISDVRTNGLSAALVPTRSAITQNLFLEFTTTQSLFTGGPIFPGSLSVSRNGITLTDSGGLLMSAGAEVGQVDYENGILSLSTNVFGSGGGTHAVTFRPAALPEMISEQAAILIRPETVSQSFAITLANLPLPKTLSVSYLAQGRWYVLRDEGGGVLRGSDSAYGAGTVNYTTGSIVVTLGALPDVGSAIVIQSYSEVVQQRASNTVLRNAGKVYVPINTSGNLSEDPGAKSISPGSVSIGWSVGGTNKTASDDGLGNLTGDATGTVDYSDGVVRISPNTLFPVGTPVLLDITSNSSLQAYGVSVVNGNIGATNIKPGSVSFLFTFDVTYSWGMYNNFNAGSIVLATYANVYDRGGKLYAKFLAGEMEFECGTINYSTGDINVTPPVGVTAQNIGGLGPLITASYWGY